MTKESNQVRESLVFNPEINKVKFSTTGNTACPFCEVDQLTDIYKTDGHKIWLKNKFPTIEKAEMTVIIESDKHVGDVSNYGKKENQEIFRFAFNCWEEMIASGNFRSVLMFKNFGPRSGGSLRHPHFQVVGLPNVNGYAEIKKENFSGLLIHKNSVDITLSDHPVMGFVEFNVSIRSLSAVEKLADQVQKITAFLLSDYMHGHCDSYNLFFYHFEDQYICKIVPRFITSPYFIGYKLSQVNNQDYLEELAETLRKLLKAD
ncbi:DUF4931 domain-containing protein [Lactococcus termiticola]|uniref:Galactose-1-phosphate uridylyltransferase n=1 Tax=Lactococcus termiticola TaxID=2169526 RepID=A0A2R5HH34_9LACT|nr:DUF4931 domain-containing protein [Lactococcus termiticola]GBG97373.1 galactose-1-phosphate uridylyltransferase [Lactococcus termiticola]